MSDRQNIVPLVLAGGRGSRLAGVRADLPKPVMPVAGRPFIAWILERLRKGGFSRAAISGGHLSDVLERQASPFIPHGMHVCWVAEPRPLGTAGGMAFTARHSGWTADRWLVMNGDSFLAGDWLETVCATPGGVLVVHRVNDVSRYGAVVIEDGRLRGFMEKGRGGEGLVNAGIYLWPTEWLGEISMDAPTSLECDVLPRWCRAGRRITVVEKDEAFIDIGTPESLASAEDFMARLHAKASS